VNLSLSRYSFAQAGGYYERALQEVRALPGVADAAWMLASPLTSDSDAEGFQVVGDPPPPKGERRPIVEVNVVSPSYWRMLDLPITRGRALAETDDEAAPHVTVVNETFVNRHVRGRDPIGVRVALGEDTVEIVGVARDMAYHSIREEPRPYAYFAARQMAGLVGLSPMVLMVRSTGKPDAILPSLRASIAGVDPRVPITGPAALGSLLDEVLLPERLGVLLVGLCSALAAIVAGVGIAAAVAYAVGRHRRDLALCIALGANPPRALREVLSPTLLHMGAGLVLGLIGGIALGRVLSGVLYGLSGVEPITLGLVTIGVMALALVATVVPARRALRLDPMEELRAD
jgi:predicted lysophospholipase L1 biosynthesis ABC-type transport system permease subunit